MSTSFVESDLQDALNRAAPGDTLLLYPDRPYIAPRDTGLILPAKQQPHSWMQEAPLPITMQSAALANLPVGRRVSSIDKSSLAQILTTGDWPALVAASESDGYILKGIETTSDGRAYVSNLVNFGR